MPTAFGGGQHGLVDHDRGQQGDDPDHRAHLDWQGGAARRHQLVVVEAVGVVPHAERGHGVRDRREVLEELEDEVLGRAAPGTQQQGGDPGHGQGIGGHPPGGVRLLKRAADRQVRAVDRADVVEPQEAALEQVVARLVLPVHPPREVDKQLVEHAAEEVEVASAVDGEDLERRPGLDRRVHVAEVPLVRGQGTVRVLEPLAAQQDELVLGEGRIDVGQRHAVEAEIPRREPRVLPLVRHRHDVEGLELAPAGVAAVAA